MDRRYKSERMKKRNTILHHKLCLITIIGSALLQSCAVSKTSTTLHPNIDMDETEWNKHKLKGQVKAVYETSKSISSYKEPSESSSQFIFNRFGKIKRSDSNKYLVVNTYNDQGQVIKKMQYFDGRLDKKEIYTYGEDGKQTSRTTYENPTFESQKEWEAHEAKADSLPHQGLYRQNKLEIKDDGNQVITVYKQNGEIEYRQFETYKRGKLEEVHVKYPFSEAFGYKKIRKYNEAGKLIKFKKYTGSKERLELILKYTYDANNRITKEVFLHYEPKSSSAFNENGHLKEQIYGYVLDEDMSSTIHYTYDANGRKTSEIKKHYNGELAYEITYENTYDDQQNIIREEIVHSEKGTRINTIKWDENGNEIFYQSVDGDGHLILKETKSFNDDSKMTSRVEYNSDGNISEKEAFTYDDKGNILEHKLWKPEDNSLVIRKRTYDEQGNWVKFIYESRSTKTDEVFFTTTRQRDITYFE